MTRPAPEPDGPAGTSGSVPAAADAVVATWGGAVHVTGEDGSIVPRAPAG